MPFYFGDRFLEMSVDHGLGTTFERFSIYLWLEELTHRYPFETVLEGPGDGVAGIPGIHSLALARQGRCVTVCLDDQRALQIARRGWDAQECQAQWVHVAGLPLPFADRSFDLVWNFNRLPFLPASALAMEMVRVSRRYVGLVVPNRYNYGFPARRLYHRRTGLDWPYGDVSVMTPSAVQALLSRCHVQVLETKWLDVPWWPDIIDPLAWVRAMVPGGGRWFSSLQRGHRQKAGQYRWDPDHLPYFDPHTYADVHRRIARLGWLERALPRPLQMPFAHHFAILAVREDERKMGNR